MTEQSLENLPRYHVPPITPFAVIVEWLIIVIVALVATSNYDLSSPKQLAGYEAEYLTSPVFLVEKNLREEGYIPLWNPWYESGEPLVENPFSFLLNPVSSVPTLIYGGLNGIKISVILSAIVAGWGGWALARVLGLRWLGRLLLALLCIGKGNMGAMIGAGWFQLGTSQAYIPWVVAGTIGILRFKHRRWPIVLTVLAFTLLFWAGNVWYTLPTLLIVATVTLSHIVKIVRVQGEQRTIWSLAINRFALRRMLMAGLLTVGFSAITLLPLLVT